MDFSTLIGKMAVSKDKVLLGKIIRIDMLVGKIIKIRKPFAIIRIRRFLKKKLLVPIDLELLKEEIEQDVYFEITHKEFDDEMKKVEKVALVRESYKEYPKITNKFDIGYKPPRRRGD